MLCVSYYLGSVRMTRKRGSTSLDKNWIDSASSFLWFRTHHLQLLWNFFFHQKVAHKLIWFNPRSKHGHIVDYVICRKWDLNVYTLRVLRIAECGSDHRLVHEKMKIRIKRKMRYKGKRIPKFIDVSRLKYFAIFNDTQMAFKEIEFDATWNLFNSNLYITSVEFLVSLKGKILLNIIMRTKTFSR